MGWGGVAGKWEKKEKGEGEKSKGGGRRWTKEAVIWNVNLNSDRWKAAGGGRSWAEFKYHLTLKHICPPISKTHLWSCLSIPTPHPHPTLQSGPENIRIGPSADVELPQKRLVRFTCVRADATAIQPFSHSAIQKNTNGYTSLLPSLYLWDNCQTTEETFHSCIPCCYRSSFVMPCVPLPHLCCCPLNETSDQIQKKMLGTSIKNK